jgi:NTE family protein
VCINEKKIYYISYENFPQMPIKTGLRMTCCIPFVFSPILYENKFYIDGGCMDNYPIHLFKNRVNDVLGIYVKTLTNNVNTINNIEEYLLYVIECLVEGIDIKLIKGYEKQTLNVPLNIVNCIDYNISSEKRLELFNSGYDYIDGIFKNI